jgi:hypothetical protein
MTATSPLLEDITGPADVRRLPAALLLEPPHGSGHHRLPRRTAHSDQQHLPTWRWAA